MPPRRATLGYLQAGPRGLSLGIGLFCLAMIAMIWVVALAGSGEGDALAVYSRHEWRYHIGAAVASACILLFALVAIAAVFRAARAAGALAESEARFRTLTGLSADWCWEMDSEFRFVDVAGAATAHARRFADESRKWDVSALKPLNTTWDAHRALLAAHVPFGDLQLERSGPDGSVHVEEITGKPIFDAHGNFRGYRGVGTDITEKLKIERALRESEARFRSLVALSSDWYWEQDDQFRFTFLSPGNRRLIDAYDATSIGKTRWELGVLGPSDDQWAEHRCLLEAHRPFRDFQYHWRGDDGVLSHISISGDPLFDVEGRFTGYRGTGSNITQRKMASAEILRLNAALEERVNQRTKQLEAANEELRAFGYSIAHDLRAPLRAIGGFSQMLHESHLPDLDAAGKTLFTRITTNVEWMGQLIDGLQALSELSAAPVTRESIDLTELAREITDEMRRLEPGREVELAISDGLAIDGDRTMVRCMMQNLIGNAWKYSSNRPAAKIEIGTLNGAKDPPAYFIKDNGAGFDMKYAGKLFQAFQRLHSPSEFQGNGIGLAIVSRIVRKHGGQIRAEAAENKGAAFYFTLRSESPV